MKLGEVESFSSLAQSRALTYWKDSTNFVGGVRRTDSRNSGPTPIVHREPRTPTLSTPKIDAIVCPHPEGKFNKSPLGVCRPRLCFSLIKQKPNANSRFTSAHARPRQLAFRESDASLVPNINNSWRALKHISFCNYWRDGVKVLANWELSAATRLIMLAGGAAPMVGRSAGLTTLCK